MAINFRCFVCGTMDCKDPHATSGYDERPEHMELMRKDREELCNMLLAANAKLEEAMKVVEACRCNCPEDSKAYGHMDDTCGRSSAIDEALHAFDAAKEGKPRENEITQEEANDIINPNPLVEPKEGLK